MTNLVDDLIEHYTQIESRFPVIDSSDRYKALVTAASNQNYPVQRWFHLKEAYSIELLENLLNDWDIDPNSIKKVLDPFCGIGTTLLSMERMAQKYELDDVITVGLERNPFLKFVAETKLGWHRFDKRKIESSAKHLLNGGYRPKPAGLPELSTLHRSDIYDSDVLSDILSFKNAISMLEADERDPLLLGYASVLEDLSGIRKDGRALRIVPNKKRPAVSQALKSAWETIIDDLQEAEVVFKPIQSQIYCGDGRTLQTDLDVPQGTFSNFDLIPYSPPYLNNIDYTEVYKIELWLCGFVTSYDEFRSLRMQTFRSHPSINFPNPVLFNLDERLGKVNDTLKILINALPEDKDRNWRTRLFYGYFDDMYQTLIKQKDVLVNGGWIFCNVGNSLHGSSKEPKKRIPVASDLLIALIADAIGLEVKAIQVARHLKRRSPNTKFLRESVIVMRKP